MNNYNKNEEEIITQCLMVSSCCGAAPLGCLEENICGHMIGICSECHQETNFEKDTEDENSR